MRNIKQVSSNTGDVVKYKGMIDCFKKIFVNEGIGAFYKGFTPMLLKLFP